MTRPVFALVPGAGVGARMGATQPKQYLPLQGKTVAEHTIERLLQHPAITEVVVGINAEDPFWPTLSLAHHERVTTVVGGAERADTVLNGLRYLLARHTASNPWVLVHDMARPCVHREDIDALLACEAADGAILGMPVADTLKQVAAGAITHTIAREHVWRAFTPQLFPLQRLASAIEQALAAGHEVTDEASAMEFIHAMPHMVRGRSDNIKITWPEDLALAAFFLQQQTQEP